MRLLESNNFGHLGAFDPQLVRLGVLAERYFAEDPVTSLMKLRQFAELLAQMAAAKLGIFQPEETQADLLKRLKWEGILSAKLADCFHYLRVEGNKANHQNHGNHATALAALKMAHVLGVWFQRAFGPDDQFTTGPFVPPANPQAASEALKQELATLRAQLHATQTAAEQARAQAEAEAQARLSAQAHAEQAAQERAEWERLATEAEQAKLAVLTQLKTLDQSAHKAPTAQVVAIRQRATHLGEALSLDEAATRALIDSQLRESGWEADTLTLRHSHGTRPQKGRNLAIAEWPTANGPADYALFVGTQCLAVVEAKKRNKRVVDAIDQAERYARGLQPLGADDHAMAGGPWPDGRGGAFHVPFVLATNGRPYLKQLEAESGVWFRDVRRPTNHRRALTGWYTPEGLSELVTLDAEAAHAELQHKPFDFGFLLRPYQQRAIQAVEATLAQQQRSLLVAMATGTGKTKLAIAMLYRLLSAKRFRRVCFVVDRSALGNQTGNEFRTTKVVNVRSFADIFGLKGLDDKTPDPETRVHICTIQSLVKRVYGDEPCPVDQYDLMIVDECHRGYTLDQELSDAELSFRDHDDYVSKYRRVLEHFDAVKIALTATPALHTREIFGEPVFTYSYREAVVDGYLIDHEPPVRIETALSLAGIDIHRGEDVAMLDPVTGGVDLTQAPDDQHFDVDAFNTRVITEPFNRAVAEALADHIDPLDPGKTLVFAANDRHADIVVAQLKAVFNEHFGPLDDGFVRKITGSVDRVQDLILQYRNDPLPGIAVTVDLLTTGVDVPRIVNLVFLRRVNSRILYEQMLGRATRRCDDIGKEVFRIFDAVDLYRTLAPVNTMQPVVTNPNVTFTQLFAELQDPAAQPHRALIVDQLVVKLRRRLKKLAPQVRDAYEATVGEPPEVTLERLQTHPPDAVATWATTCPKVGPLLDWTPRAADGYRLPIALQDDHVVAVSRGYGRLEDGQERQRPEDFLDAFASYVRHNVNEVAALAVVVQRPRELTRSTLKELKLALDRLGYSEVQLQTAWRETRNQDIAASIIGFVRQAALGDPLIPYEDRVNAALATLLARHPWSENQRMWLRRIGKQYLKEIVVDRDALDQGQFRQDVGGFENLNKRFDGQLETLLADFNESIWSPAIS